MFMFTSFSTGTVHFSFRFKRGKKHHCNNSQPEVKLAVICFVLGQLWLRWWSGSVDQSPAAPTDPRVEHNAVCANLCVTGCMIERLRKHFECSN